MYQTPQQSEGSICSPHWPFSLSPCESANNNSNSPHTPSLLSLFPGTNEVPLSSTPFLPPPAPAPSAFSSSSASTNPRPRRRFLNPCERLQQRAIRAEKNRYYARENRQRKRMHVELLENEVLALRTELAQCKERLGRYELIERQRAMACTDSNFVIRDAFQEMARSGADPELFPMVMTQKLDQLTEERKKAMAQLSRLILEIAVPLPLRLAFWEAENNIDMYDPQNFCRRMGYKLDGEAMRILAEHMKRYHASAEAAHKMREKMAAVSQNVRRDVKRMLEAQRDMERELMKISQLGRKFFMSRYTLDFAADELKFSPRLSGRPELTDQAIFQVSEQDLSLETQDECADEWDDFFVGETRCEEMIKA